LGISCWVDFEMPPKMRAIAHAHAKERNHASLKYREAFMTIAIGRRGGDTFGEFEEVQRGILYRWSVLN
jgi:hypothetical protein